MFRFSRVPDPWDDIPIWWSSLYCAFSVVTFIEDVDSRTAESVWVSGSIIYFIGQDGKVLDCWFLWV